MLLRLDRCNIAHGGNGGDRQALGGHGPAKDSLTMSVSCALLGSEIIEVQRKPTVTVLVLTGLYPTMALCPICCDRIVDATETSEGEEALCAVAPAKNGSTGGVLACTKTTMQLLRPAASHSYVRRAALLSTVSY